MPVVVRPLETRIAEALAAAVLALTPQVPASQLYLRPAGLFVPDRDKLPALLACVTPGQGVTTRRMLRPGRAEATCFTTVILIDAQNAGVTAAKPVEPDRDWRAGWRLEVVSAVGGHPLSAVPEVVRAFAEPGETLDMSQFEASNLWWSAVTFRTLARVDSP